MTVTGVVNLHFPLIYKLLQIPVCNLKAWFSLYETINDLVQPDQDVNTQSQQTSKAEGGTEIPFVFLSS